MDEVDENGKFSTEKPLYIIHFVVVIRLLSLVN